MALNDASHVCFCVDGGETERGIDGVCKWCDGHERLRVCPACPEGEIDHSCKVCDGHNLVPAQGTTERPRRYLEEEVTHVLKVGSAEWVSNNSTGETYLNIVFKGRVEVFLHEHRQEEAIQEFISACRFLDSYVEDIETWDPTSVVGLFVEVTARQRTAKNGRTFMKYSFSPAESPADPAVQRARAAAILADIDAVLGPQPQPQSQPLVQNVVCVHGVGSWEDISCGLCSAGVPPPCRHGVTSIDGGQCAQCFLERLAPRSR